MEGNLGTRAAALAVGLLLVVAACDGTGDPVPDEVLSTTIVPTVSTTVPRAPAESDVNVVIDHWAWTTVRGPAVGFGPPALVSNENVLYSDDLVIVESLPTREVVVERAPNSSDVEWLTQDVVMGSGRVAVSETTVGYPLEYRVAVIDLASGEEEVVAETDPILPERRAIPSLAMTGSRLFWTETLPSGSVCVLSIDFDDRGTPEIVVCSDPGGNSALVDIQVARSTLSYIHSTYNPIRDTSCFEFVVLDLGSDESGTTLGGEPCEAFQGAGVGSVAVWSEVSPGSSVIYDDLPLQGTVRGDRVALGSGVGGSVRACRDHLYWMWVAPDGSSSQIRTWEPGRPIRIILEENRLDWKITGDIGCTETHITVVRSFSGPGPVQGEILTARLP